jgi:hypothetical protein
LKQTFVQHCKSCEGQANQDYKARYKAHQERIAACDDGLDSDSEGSLDSQAALMDEIKAVEVYWSVPQHG